MFSLFKRFGRNAVEPTLPSATESIGLRHLSDAEKVSDAFPNLRHLAINLAIRAPDHEIEPSLTNRSFGPQSRAYFHFRCKNVECIEGGFDLRDEIQAASDAGRSDISGRRVCQGWRDANMRGHQKCYFELNFKIHLSYTE